jgi:ubiquitin-activating enzyme E1
MDVGSRAVTDRLSRYIGAMGLDAVRAQAESEVLVLGAGALAAEIAKNIILSGIKRLTIRENPHFITKPDISGHCFLRLSDIGKVRAEAVSTRLQQLNAYSLVDCDSQALNAEEIKAHYTAVVMTETPWEAGAGLERELREKGVAVVAADAFGLFGRVFVDFGDEFAVADVNGEDPQEYVIATITNEAEGLVTLISKHNLEDGSQVLFSGLQGISELNGTVHTVKVVNTTSFRIGNTANLGLFAAGGTAVQLRKSGLFRFESLENNLKRPRLDQTYEFADFEKAGEWVPQHVAMLALDRAILQLESTDSALNSVLTDFPAADKALTQAIWADLNRSEKGVFPPLCSYLGGLAAQEVIKALTHKFTPIQQLLYFNTRELSTPAAPQWSLDPVEACLSQSLVAALAQASVFMVGVGAIGCELLKNMSLLGMCTAGKLTITDPDHIENSNLSRQFLFREKHIRLPKAAVAAAAAVDLNPALREHLLPRLDKVHEPTAHIFSESFFSSQTLVLTALDNIQARRYVDSRCVSARIPLVDSGTLGNKGHVQVILPQSTETYSERSDPEDDHSIPVCTLKLFPEETVHCIEWALDLFARYFTVEPALVRACLQPSGADLAGEKLAKIIKILRKWPQSFEDCIHFAWRKFHKLFNSDPQRLMHVYPADAKTSDGKLFWTLPKRPPFAVNFSVDREDHVEFLLSAACLKARVSGIHVPLIAAAELRGRVIDIARSFPVKQFRLSEEQALSIRAQVDSKEESAVPAVSSELQSELKSLISSLSVESRPESFEKDNDSNCHVDFIHSACNSRAQVYSLKPADWITVKLKAGRVVPALATTTAVVAALQTIEAVKVINRMAVHGHRNAFINLAASVCAMTEPCAPRVMYTLQRSGPVTAWTRWEVPASLTLAGLCTYLNDHYGVQTRDVLQASKHIYLESLMSLPAKQAEKASLLKRNLKDLLGGQEEDLRVHFTLPGDEKLLQSPPVRLCL